ncbi:hypothetical protein QF032_006422 [Streptomyces achromogenes]|uniref:hypothetical protein n=1 Tax=Streptomyces achromogenes TaxID=67255 RepID=UPI00278AD5BD|nr:hypothetical protein [Streptomyces achromogenes]MDQ0834578.1 hypothetical protein [Streptomyces achromogenes]
MRRHRVDPAARLYYENGEKEKRLARGTKWFFASARYDGYWQRAILAVRHVAGGDYEDEAAVAVRSFSQLSSLLPGCMGVIYDGAFRGVHRDALARLGLLVINRQHGSVKPRAYELLRFGRCRHDLWCDQGRIAERVLLDDGTSTLMPVPVSRHGGVHDPGPCGSALFVPPAHDSTPSQSALAVKEWAVLNCSSGRPAHLPTGRAQCDDPSDAPPRSTGSSSRAAGEAALLCLLFTAVRHTQSPSAPVRGVLGPKRGASWRPSRAPHQ